MITDDHAHLDHKWLLDKFENISNYINLQEKNGVKYIIANSMDIESSKLSLEMAKKHKIILPAIGLYPIDENYRESINDRNAEFKPNYAEIDDYLAWIKGNISKSVALGEVGLDYSNDLCHKESQKYVFSKLVDLAVSKNIPLIIHSRKAEADILEILNDKNAKKVVLHCFSGKKTLINEAKKRKYYFSIPTSIVRSQHFQMIANDIDVSRILTETDAPFMSPYKDQEPNESRFIIESLKIISKIKNMDIEETQKVIFQNFQKLYL